MSESNDGKPSARELFNPVFGTRGPTQEQLALSKALMALKECRRWISEDRHQDIIMPMIEDTIHLIEAQLNDVG